MERLSEGQIQRRSFNFTNQFLNKEMEGEFDFYDIMLMKRLFVKAQRYEPAANMRDQEKKFPEFFILHYPDAYKYKGIL